MKLYINNVAVKLEFSFVLVISIAIAIGNYNLLYALIFSALHEMGHIALLYALGGRAESITIACYGIGLKHCSALSFNGEIAFLLGGIAVNLIFALFNIQRDINMALFIINALPVYPLDGGRVLKLLLCKYMNVNLSDRLLAIVGMLFIALIIIYSLIRGNASLALIAVYLIVYSLNNSF